jgi:hypothetical protein
MIEPFLQTSVQHLEPRNQNMSRIALLALLLPCFPALAQTNAPVEAPQTRSSVKDPVQGGWSVGEAENETLYFSFDLMVESPIQGLDQLRSERNTYLARNNGSITSVEQENLDRAAMSLNSAYPNSFEAHMANYYARFPQPLAFVELEQASALSPQRTELVAPRLLAAARQDDRAVLATRARDMKARGDVAPALYLYAEDLFRSVDENGVLICAGEMDALPLWVKQYADGKRSDVLVIDRRLLGDADYRGRMWQRAGANGAVPGDEIGFISRLHTSTGRPVFLSLAVGSQLARNYAGQLSVSGLALRMSQGASGDMRRLAALWEDMHKRTDAGPIAANYLVPGALLLKHYRAVEDERNASQLEAELRAMAQRLGATNAMIANGIFLH